MSEYTIYIDNRERDLIELLKKENEGVLFEETNLEVGDIQFRKDEFIFMVIERKTFSDLSASIKDGRYKEQKQRLLHSLPKQTRKIYLIEGNDMRDFHLDKSVFDGVMINNVIRDHIMIYRTKNLEDTMNWFVKIKEHVDKKLEEILISIEDKEGDTPEYQVMKMVKKENLNEKVAFKTMLSVIPQISNSIAEVLYEKYKNMENFIKEVRRFGEDDYVKMMRVLSEERYGTNQRRMGEPIAKKILIYLFHISDEDKEKIEDKDFGKEPKKKRISKKKNESEEVEMKKEKEVKPKVSRRVKKNEDISLSMFTEDNE